MRNRPPNLSTVGGVDRQTGISNERLRTISCIGVKQIPQEYGRLVMGSLGSQHKQPAFTHRPSNKLIPCWLTTTHGSEYANRNCKFLPKGGANLLQHPPNTSQKHPPHTPTPQQQTTHPQNTQKTTTQTTQTIEPNYLNHR